MKARPHNKETDLLVADMVLLLRVLGHECSADHFEKRYRTLKRNAKKADKQTDRNG